MGACNLLGLPLNDRDDFAFPFDLTQPRDFETWREDLSKTIQRCAERLSL